MLHVFGFPHLAFLFLFIAGDARDWTFHPTPASRPLRQSARVHRHVLAIGHSRREGHSGPAQHDDVPFSPRPGHEIHRDFCKVG